MRRSGSTTNYKSEWSLQSQHLWPRFSFLMISYWHDENRTAPLLDGEEGKERKERVWHEIIDALRKDVPEVLQYIRWIVSPTISRVVVVATWEFSKVYSCPIFFSQRVVKTYNMTQPTRKREKQPRQRYQIASSNKRQYMWHWRETENTHIRKHLYSHYSKVSTEREMELLADPLRYNSPRPRVHYDSTQPRTDKIDIANQVSKVSVSQSIGHCYIMLFIYTDQNPT